MREYEKKDMKKIKIIKNIIGTSVAKEDYCYVLKEKDVWSYEKTGDVICKICIQESKLEKQLRLYFETNAFQCPRKFVKDILTDEDNEKYKNIGYIPDIGWWSYASEEDFVEIIKAFREIIEKYEKPVMQKLMVEEEIIPTFEMAERLYKDNKSLAEKFMQENSINVKYISLLEIRKWFELIEKLIDEKQGEKYVNVQELLLKISAFLGNEIIKYASGKWVHQRNSRATYISNLECYILDGILILDYVINMWKENSIHKLEDIYEYLYESKLPLSEEKMLNMLEWKID